MKRGNAPKALTKINFLIGENVKWLKIIITAHVHIAEPESIERNPKSQIASFVIGIVSLLILERKPILQASALAI
jgi:hypothetical protein